MFNPADLKAVIERLERQKAGKAIHDVLEKAQKTYKLPFAALQETPRSVMLERENKVSKEYLAAEQEKLPMPDPRNTALLHEFIQKDIETKMRQEKLASYQLALKIQALAIPRLTTTLEKELQEAQEALNAVSKRTGRLDCGDRTKASKTYDKKTQALVSLMQKMSSGLLKELEEKCNKWNELYRELLSCRKTEIPKIPEKFRVEFAKLQDDVLESMVEPAILIRTVQLRSKLRMFLIEFGEKNSTFSLGIQLEHALETNREKILQERALQIQALDKQKQDFALALKQAEGQAQRLAHQEINAKKPQAGVVAKETKLTDEELLIDDLQEFLAERIASSKKGLEEFDSKTKEPTGKKTIERNFHAIFKTEELFKLRLPLNETESRFLQYLYRSNAQYYLSIKQYIELLRTPIVLADWHKLLEKIRVLDIARFRDAKKELENLGINDASILTQLLIPVYRLVFKFQKEQLLPLTKLICETDVRILRGKKMGLLSNSSSSSSNVKPAAVKAKNTVNGDLKGILGQNLSPLEIVSQVALVAQTLQQDILKLKAQTHTASDSAEVPEAVTSQSPVLQEVSFLSENFTADIGLLERANALDIIKNLFFRKPTICYKDFYNMLRILRGENPVTEHLSGHVMFQFPMLWGGMGTPPQVLVGIHHTSGMPTVSQIQDHNTLRDLRNACREAGMTPSIIEQTQAESENFRAEESEAVVEETVLIEQVQPNRKAGYTWR